MKKSVKIFCLSTLFLAFSFVLFAQNQRPEWSEVEGPEIISIETDKTNEKTVIVSFNLETSTKGADKAIVEMYDSNNNLVESKNIGKTKKITKTTKFTPSKSGEYFFVVRAVRNKVSGEKKSEKSSYNFLLPLQAPEVTARNTNRGEITFSWSNVSEAEKYNVLIFENDSKKEIYNGNISATEYCVKKLKPNTTYCAEISALRNNEKKTTKITKTASEKADRIWQFTWFGQSTNGERNTMKMLDADKMIFELNSCTFNKDTQKIIDKGGKFTTFHDGISFYYTEIDPKTENFELTATFTVNFINNPADGQEGFGLIAMDSLGENGVSMTNHYTNSAGIIATKFEETIGGTKKTSKDTLGTRFVSGITKEVLAEGETSIAENGKNVSKAFSYEKSDLIQTGKTYRITLKKTNTGYHGIYKGENDEKAIERIMYDGSKLMQLDQNKVYVGFAVARGCNVTVSDVVFNVTDPKKDAPAQEEPAEIIALKTKIDSPTSYSEERYPFVFNANANGKITIQDSNGKKIVNNRRVTANKDFSTKIKLSKGNNDFIVTFEPNARYVPGKKQVLGYFDEVTKEYVAGVKTQVIKHSVVYNFFENSELYVSPEGKKDGLGTKDSPLDLETAINFCKSGQKIILSGGTYNLSKALIIQRRNDGTKNRVKTLCSEENQRAILDFTGAKGGFQAWGNYWVIENIDICNTDGNIKGLQIAGNFNVVRGVNTYNCGDTGCQISGTSTETFEKWPKNNLIENCTSYANCDPAQNNADGFAAKLTCGNGNVFRGCIAYSNIDDGWDLFAKAETGLIGEVLIENCVAYANGSLLDGSGNGDGNGFKLGGDGIGIAHVLKNSIAFNNGTTGITSNSNPNVVLENVTSFGNKLRNIALYGKGNGERFFKAKGVLSVNGSEGDNISEMPELKSKNNYFWTGAFAENLSGEKFSKDIFEKTDMTIVPTRKADGSIEMNGLLKLKQDFNKPAGAKL